MNDRFRSTRCLSVALAILMAALILTGPASAGVPTGNVVGFSLSATVGEPAGNGLPIAEGGLMALLAGGIVGGVYLARRKR